MNTPSFTLITGGPIYRFLRGLGSTHMGQHILTASGISWIPLLILTLIHDLISKQEALHTFLVDPIPYARYLLAIPIFLGATPIVDRWSSAALQHLTTSGIVSDSDIEQVSGLMSKMLRVRNSLIPELIMLVVAYTNSIVQIHAEKRLLSVPWLMLQNNAGPHLSLAGWWNYLISLPLFGFLALIWIWRFGIWAYFLIKVSRYNLRLIPIHPDFTGGIAFLTIPQRAFGVINLAFGIVIAASIAQNIIFRGASASDFETAALVYSLASPAITLAPLLMFAPKLVRTRYSGLIKYSSLADEYTEAFDDKWIERHAEDGEELLGTSDIQSLADLANSFNVVRSMKIFPFTIKDYLVLVVVSSVPFIPLILTVIPAKELVIRLARLLFQ